MALSKSKNTKVLFRTQEEAELETGFFSVFSLMITCELSEKIGQYLSRCNLETFSQPNQAKTSWNTYTLNFTLKSYRDGDNRRAYLSKPGALGYYKNTIARQKFRNNPGTASESISFQHPKEEDLNNFADLQERSPTILQMYFWIVRKYPNDLIWMDYSVADLSGNPFEPN